MQSDRRAKTFTWESHMPGGLGVNPLRVSSSLRSGLRCGRCCVCRARCALESAAVAAACVELAALWTLLRSLLCVSSSLRPGLRCGRCCVCRASSTTPFEQDTLRARHPLSTTPFEHDTFRARHPSSTTPLEHDTLRARHPSSTTPFEHDTLRARHTSSTTHFKHDTLRARHTSSMTHFEHDTFGARHPSSTTPFEHNTLRELRRAMELPKPFFARVNPLDHDRSRRPFSRQ